MPLEMENFNTLDEITGFSRAALETFTKQFKENVFYRKYCESLNKTPSSVKDWSNIPALPTDVFKIESLPINIDNNAVPAEIFYTSGTTAEIKGKHVFPEITTYEQSILGAWDSLDLPNRDSLVFLSQKKEDAPHSSLVHMFETMRKDAKLNQDRFIIDSNGTIHTTKLKDLCAKEKPFGVCGTALAFLHLLEKKETIPLPTGSWILETGGYKGSSHSMSKKELYTELEQVFSIPQTSIINEYSMTELSSQFYTSGLDQAHKGPAWTRVKIINPETNQEVAIGEAGYLIIYDLANIHSIMAIRTQDIAIRHGDSRCFHLVGRDPKAIARGCSRASDEILSNKK